MKQIRFLALWFLFSVIFWGCTSQPSQDTTMNNTNNTAVTTIETVKVIYVANGGSEVASVDIEIGHKIPYGYTEKEGHYFLGWYTSEDGGLTVKDYWRFDFDYLYEDIILYANWRVETYHIFFESGTNTEVDSIFEKYGTIIAKPETPIKKGYTFLGWFKNLTDEEEFEFNTMPAENLTLYGKWEINDYTINYMIMDDGYNPGVSSTLFPDDEITNLSLNNNSAFVTSSNRIFIWGNNDYGQLGINSTTSYFSPYDISSYFENYVDNKITGVYLGGYHTAALTENGSVFVWGKSDRGQIGTGPTIYFPGYQTLPINITQYFDKEPKEKIVELSLGDSHTLALSSLGNLFVWGSNNSGQLGNGEYENGFYPENITSNFNLYAEEKIVQISTFDFHNVVLTSLGRVFTWGSDYYSQMGNYSSFSDARYPLDITSNFNFLKGEQIIQVAAGGGHTLALSSMNRIFAWGDNRFNQIGYNLLVGEKIDHPITNITIPSLLEGENIIEIKAGGSHSAFLTSHGRVFTLGSNSKGQLGIDSSESRNYTNNITSNFPLETGEKIVKISLGREHTCAISSRGRIFMFGENSKAENVISPYELPLYQAEWFNQVDYTFDETIDIPIPFRDGYTFSGWFEDLDFLIPYEGTKMSDKDVTIYGRWIKN